MCLENLFSVKVTENPFGFTVKICFIVAKEKKNPKVFFLE